MIAKIVGCVLGVGLLGGASLACAQCDYDQDQAIKNSSFVSPDVKGLVDKGIPCARDPARVEGERGIASPPPVRRGGVDSGEIPPPVSQQFEGSREMPPPVSPRALISDNQMCTQENAGDVIEALMHKDFDVFNVVKDTIVTCIPCENGKNAEYGPEIAALVATRALRVKGPGAKYMIDAAVLAAATEIGGRQCGGTAAAPDQEQRAFEKERLARIMEKGLTNDEYIDFMNEKTRAFTPVAPVGPAPDPALYRGLYNAGVTGVLGSSVLDQTLDQRTDPGGYASVQ